MKKWIFIFAILILAANAFAFEISSSDATLSVRAGGMITTELNLTGDSTETVSLSFIDGKTWVTSNIQNIALTSGDVKPVTISISPLPTTQLGLYKVTVVAESFQTGVQKKSDIFINVERGEHVYIEKIMVTGNLEPKGYAKISIDVKNYMTVTVSDISLNIVVASPTKNILDTTLNIDKLDPLQTKTIDDVVTLDSLAESGEYVVYAKASYQSIIERGEQSFTVLRKSILTKQYEKIPLILGYEKKITVVNEGNQVGDDVIYDNVPQIDSIFFYGDTPISKIGEKYGWEVKNLAPGEQKVITYYVDYSPMIIFIIAIVIALWIFFYKYRTVTISKYILHKKFIEEGEDFTVAIEIHNGLQKFEEITVNDFVPPIFKIKDTEGITPQKKSTSVGTELTWKLRDMKRKETRLFTYKVVPIFGVNGTIKLPKASVEFKYAKKMTRNTSNATEIGIVENILPETHVKNVKKMFKKKKD